MSVPPFAIGSDTWPGVAKVIEEAGELQQVLGKVMAYPDGEHPDGEGDLTERLLNEAGDVVGALAFLIKANGLDWQVVVRRSLIKQDRFDLWHAEELRRRAGP